MPKELGIDAGAIQQQVRNITETISNFSSTDFTNDEVYELVARLFDEISNEDLFDSLDELIDILKRVQGPQ